MGQILMRPWLAQAKSKGWTRRYLHILREKRRTCRASRCSSCTSLCGALDTSNSFAVQQDSRPNLTLNSARQLCVTVLELSHKLLPAARGGIVSRTHPESLILHDVCVTWSRMMCGVMKDSMLSSDIWTLSTLAGYSDSSPFFSLRTPKDRTCCPCGAASRYGLIIKLSATITSSSV